MILVLFMYIFSFPLLKNINETGSNFIIGAVLFLFFLINKRYKSIVFSTMKKKYVIKIYILLTIVLIFSFTIPTIMNTKDYSILINFISQYIVIFVGILIYGLYEFKEKLKLLPIHLVYIFIIQSLIQFISLILPVVNNVLNNFRTESAINLGQLGFYEGTRGLAISGQAFFGLGVGYGLAFLLLIDNWKSIANKVPVLKYVYIGLLSFGATSAARTSLIGLIIAIVYVCIKKIAIENKIVIFSKKNLGNKILIIIFFLPFVLLAGIIGINSFINDQQIQQVFNTFMNFALEFIKSFTTTGEFSTNSTDILFGRMYFPIENLKTLFFGDGYYTSITGSYYMSTDAGYMRNILFFGMTGLILLLRYQLSFFYWRNKKYILLNSFIMFYILIIHIKGEALGFSTMLISMLILNFLYQKNIEFE